MKGSIAFGAHLRTPVDPAPLPAAIVMGEGDRAIDERILWTTSSLYAFRTPESRFKPATVFVLAAALKSKQTLQMLPLFAPNICHGLKILIL